MNLVFRCHRCVNEGHEYRGIGFELKALYAFFWNFSFQTISAASQHTSQPQFLVLPDIQSQHSIGQCIRAEQYILPAFLFGLLKLERLRDSWLMPAYGAVR